MVAFESGAEPLVRKQAVEIVDGIGEAGAFAQVLGGVFVAFCLGPAQGIDDQCAEQDRPGEGVLSGQGLRDVG